MKLRGYIGDYDFPCIKRWVDSERTNALFCAQHMKYPLTREDFEETIKRNQLQWRDTAFTAIDDEGNPLGFLMFNINYEKNSAYLKYILINNELRGQGYGGQMLELVKDYAKYVAKVDIIALGVFEINKAAYRCYEKAGFRHVLTLEDDFIYNAESWKRYRMEYEIK